MTYIVVSTGGLTWCGKDVVLEERSVTPGGGKMVRRKGLGLVGRKDLGLVVRQQAASVGG